MNENYNGRMHYHLSRTTLKSCTWSYFNLDIKLIIFPLSTSNDNLIVGFDELYSSLGSVKSYLGSAMGDVGISIVIQNEYFSKLCGQCKYFSKTIPVKN